MLKATVLRLLSILTLVIAPAVAQAWPDRPVRLIVPYPPGAMGDTVSRLLAEDLRGRLGQPVVVENRAGASGNIGAAYVARGANDGHTFLVAAANNLVINQFLYRQMGFDPLRDLVPVSVLVDVPTVLFANAQVPATDFKAFAAHARSHRGTVNYGSPGAGTTVHLFTALLDKAQGLGMLHVAYKGAAPAMTGLLANEVQLLAIGAGIGAPHVKAGKLRALAVSGPRRLPMFPDAQTFAEAGLNEEGASNWWGVAAPAGTPPAVVAQLQGAMRDALATPALRARLDELGAVPVASTPQDMAVQLEREAGFWSRTVRASGIQLD